MKPVIWLAWIMAVSGLVTMGAWGIDWIGIKLAAIRRQARQVKSDGHLTE